MRFYERMNGLVLLAGFLCFFSAMTLVVLLSVFLTNAGEARVIDIHGNDVAVPDYTPHERAGRDVYIRQVCWHCHSQFVRPVNDEDIRFGPVSQPGESAIDRPHLFSTRRIGPDLAREGWLRIDDWQLAHLFDPRATVPLSVMPSFTWLFRDVDSRDEMQRRIAELDSDGDGVVSKVFDSDPYPTAWPSDAAEVLKSPRLDNGGVEAPAYRQDEKGLDLVREGGQPSLYERQHDRWTATDTSDGLLSDYDARPRPTQEALDLVAYLQRLGIAIGPWRQPIPAATPIRMDRLPMKGVTATWRDSKGAERTTVLPDGQMPQRSRRARLYGLARSRATPEQLAAAEDLAREYDAVLEAWYRANPAWRDRLARGRQVYDQHCTACHGPEGRGNGPGAAHFLIRPRDFTLATYRYRSTRSAKMPLDGDLHRSIYRGLWGTAMPSFRQLPDGQIWLLVDFLKSLRETQEDAGEPWDDLSTIVAVPPPPPVADAEEWATRVQRGRAVYMAMQCFDCHGSEGRGDGPGWGKTKADGGLIRPRDLKARNARDIPSLRLRGGAAPQDLYRSIMTGLDGANMKGSAEDFRNAWEAADALTAAEERGTAGADLESRRTAARRRLMVALPDDLSGVGVVTVEGAQYLDRIQRDDDWNLVFYVMSLLGLEPTISR